jgi:hypothetical protein
MAAAAVMGLVRGDAEDCVATHGVAAIERLVADYIGMHFAAPADKCYEARDPAALPG